MNELMEDQQEGLSYEDKMKGIQDKWTLKIKELNEKMKSLPELDSLLNVVYAERQNACDYYFSLLNILSKLGRQYKAEFATKYNYYKTQSQIRFSSDSAISAQIESDLIDMKEKISFVETHYKYMQETIKTIDNIIYGVNNKIKIYELINGIKG